MPEEMRLLFEDEPAAAQLAPLGLGATALASNLDTVLFHQRRDAQLLDGSAMSNAIVINRRPLGTLRLRSSPGRPCCRLGHEW